MKKEAGNTILCPIDEPIESLSFPKEEIEPLLDYLAKNNPINDVIKFRRGTITSDKKLDCCKQDLGVVGAQLLSEALKSNKTIQSILLGTGGIGNQGAESVASLLTENQTIETVYLGCNRISETGTQALADSLKDNKQVKALWLKRNPIGFAGAKSIAQLLKNNRNIRSLDLVNTQIGLEGLDALVKTLIQESHPIKRLYLSGNAFSAEAGSILAELLEKNTSLEELYLSVNCLGEKGILDLTAGLQKNQNLIALGLASNGINDVAAISLFESIAQHPSLQVLDLGYSRSTKVLGAISNQISDDSAEALSHLLINNKQLFHLDLVRNTFSIKTFNQILKALQSNCTLKELKLGKGFKGETKEKIQNILAQNLSLQPDAVFHKHKDVQMIRSVYR